MQIDNDKVYNIHRDLVKTLNSRELTELSDMLMNRVSIRSGNPVRKKAAASYTKIISQDVFKKY